MKRKLSHAESVVAAEPIKQIAELARTLDIEYLTAALKEMKDNHALRDSAMILNPSPHTALQQQYLNSAKIKGLELMLELAKNQNDIFNCTLQLESAKRQSSYLSSIFGF